MATNANSPFPQPTPSVSYILGANSGKLNPAIVRTNAAAPVALAAYVVYASTMYACAHWKLMMHPVAKMAAPMLGTIKWMEARAVKP